MLTGALPYPRDSVLLTLNAHLDAPIPRPSDTDAALAPFDSVIATALAKSPTTAPPPAPPSPRSATPPSRESDPADAMPTLNVTNLKGV